jgi:hypothetical protein
MIISRPANRRSLRRKQLPLAVLHEPPSDRDRHGYRRAFHEPQDSPGNHEGEARTNGLVCPSNDPLWGLHPSSAAD